MQAPFLHPTPNLMFLRARKSKDDAALEERSTDANKAATKDWNACSDRNASCCPLLLVWRLCLTTQRRAWLLKSLNSFCNAKIFAFLAAEFVLLQRAQPYEVPHTSVPRGTSGVG